MRITTTLVAAGILLWVSLPAIADSVEIKDMAQFTLREAAGYQREIVFVLPSPSAQRESTLGQEGPMLSHVSIIVLEDCCQGPRPMSQDDPATEDSDAPVLRRRRLAAAAEAGLNKLKLGGSQRKFVRTMAIAFEGSCSDALTLYTDGKLTCEQLILVDPVLEELPAIAQGRTARAIDVVLRTRSNAEAARLHKTALEKLGAWGNTARVFTGGGNWNLKRVYDLFRGFRVHDPEKGQPYMDAPYKTETELDRVIEACRRADVVIVGELHGNPGAHDLQLAVLERLGIRRKSPFALSTEQFERDVQAKLDEFMARDVSKLKPQELGEIEQAFMKATRAWPNYADYRPLVEFCRDNKYPVIAGNVPRPLAARINKEGLDAFEKFTAEEKGWSATKINAPDGAYKDKFFEVMGSSTSAKKDDKYAAMERMYTAQCLKDDTMAESIVAWLDKNKNGKVLHINGAFHSAGGLGVPEKLKAMRPDLKIVVITCIEADNPFTEDLDPEDTKGNDFVVFVPGSRPNRSNEGPSHPK
ncbi:MAG: ChaN family lipoprotein [Planctomycetes bacterium]|nr:ChaN family lipoprotein [Planctomycetota bacterium]